MSTAIEKAKKMPLSAVTKVSDLLWNDEAKMRLQLVAASHMKPERMMRLISGAIRTTPKLAECDPMSLLGGLMTCAGLGLEPNTIMGHAYLIPFKNGKKGITEVQLVVGYKGLIDLARRSGHITSISAHVHYSDDELWEYREGTSACLDHVPGPQEGQKLHAYAITTFRDGGHAYVVLPWSKVMKIRDGSQGWQTAVRFNNKAKSPWSTHEDEMAKKTAIRALAKYLPLSVEFRDAITVDGGKADFAAFAMNPAEQLDATPEDDEGQTIDGEVMPVDEADEEEAKAASKVDEKPKQEPKKAKPVDETPKDEPSQGDVEDHASGLVERIMADLSEADSADAADAVMALWADQIATLPKVAQGKIERAAADAAKGAK